MEKQSLRPSPTALLNPRSDPAFKGIFTQGTEQSELALKSFLSAMIGRSVVQVTLQPNEPAVESTDQMQMTFDVSVRFEDGEFAEIEMQGQKQKYDYKVRSEGQAARLLNSTIKKSNEWNLQKVYQITVLNFEHDKDDNKVLSWYTMKDSEGSSLGDRLNVIYLDLTKAEKLLEKSDTELKSYEKWDLFFAYEDDESKAVYLRKILESEKGLMAAHNTVETMSKSEENWASQLSYENAILDWNTCINNARREGVNDGVQQKAIETASAMLKKKYPINDISEITGLSIEDIQKLENQ